MITIELRKCQFKFMKGMGLFGRTDMELHIEGIGIQLRQNYAPIKQLVMYQSVFSKQIEELSHLLRKDTREITSANAGTHFKLDLVSSLPGGGGGEKDKHLMAISPRRASESIRKELTANPGLDKGCWTISPGSTGQQHIIKATTTITTQQADQLQGRQEEYLKAIQTISAVTEIKLTKEGKSIRVTIAGTADSIKKAQELVEKVLAKQLQAIGMQEETRTITKEQKGMIIGKGGETIKTIRQSSGAFI